MKLRTAMALVALVAFGAAAAGIGVRATYGAQASVDEPQYLLTAISIAEDRSLDISDEIAGERYRPFHEVALDRQTEPQPDGSEVSPHDPLLPLLLALPMELGGWVGAKFLLALTNGLLGAVLVWTAVRRFSVPVRTAALAVVVFVASAPFAVYGNQVYPELPAALAVAVSIALLTGPLTARALWGLGAAVVTLPWLSIKYAPVAAAIALTAAWFLTRSGERSKVAGLLGGLALAGVAYVTAHLAWYGGVTVYSAGDHFASTGEFSVVGTQVDLVGRSTRLVGLLIDDKFGLALWQPAFLLALVALGAMVRARPQGSGVLAVVAVVGWLNATFVALTMQGWWWPGRQTVIVLPALVIGIAWWTARGLRRSWIVGGLGAIGVVSYLWLVVEGVAGRLTWVVDFFDTSNPWYRLAAEVTPDYLDPTGTTWLLHGLWLGIAAALVVLGYRSERGDPGGYSLGEEPLVVEAEPDPDPELDDEEPSTSRTPLPSSSHATPVSAATITSAAKPFLVPVRICPPV